jgi:hypothetical protein
LIWNDKANSFILIYLYLFEMKKLI